MIIGTPGYMSPAQISDERVDHRTDLWSCGVVLYEFLTGKNPFEGANRQETFEAILSRNPPPCSSLNPDIPQELDRILAKLLEKDPALGYQSSVDLRADLKRVKREIDSSPSWSTGGGGSGARYEAGRFLNTKTWTVALALIAIFALALGAWRFLLQNSAAPVESNEWSQARTTQLTDAAGTELFPSLSPDGKSCVYTTQVNSNWDILLQRVGRVRDGEMTGLGVSHDGTLVYYVVNEEESDIWMLNAAH